MKAETEFNQFLSLIQTTRTSLVVRDVGPGKWYQFRVAAVSVNGTRSFTDGTKPLKLSRGRFFCFICYFCLPIQTFPNS